MEVVINTLLRGLGAILSFFYSVIPSYGLAIILLTVLVRMALFPLTFKQTRSMQAMQKVQPKVKELQRKYKGNRQKLNEELMKLYKEHQVNPLGGCLPLVLQLPVFFALYAVLRGTIAHAAIPTEPVNAESLEEWSCAPAGEPAPTGTVSSEIICEGPNGARRTFTVSEWKTRDLSAPIRTPGAYMFHCVPQAREGSGSDYFICSSTLGISHLPADSELRMRIISGNASFLGMELACSPTQAASDERINECARRGVKAGGFPLVGYFGLVALMVASTWFQQRQMQRASAGPQAQQAQLMGRIMPIFLGFISINIPTGVLVYWVTSNGLQIAQQTFMLRSRDEAGPPARGDGKASPGERPRKPAGGAAPKGKGSQKSSKSPQSGSTGSKSSGSKSGGRNARGRKKRS